MTHRPVTLSLLHATLFSTTLSSTRPITNPHSTAPTNTPTPTRPDTCHLSEEAAEPGCAERC
jgi:hypothetical protein